MGSFPLRDINTWSPLTASFHTRLTFHPQRFARSRWFSPPHTLPACFISLPRPGFHFRGFPRYRAEPPLDDVIPSCRCRCFPATERTRQRQISAPRLQGFDLDIDPLSLAEMLFPTSARSPLVFSTSLGFLSENLGNALALPPLMTFTDSRYVSTHRSVFSVSIDFRPVVLSPERRSRSSFLTRPSKRAQIGRAHV